MFWRIDYEILQGYTAKEAVRQYPYAVRIVPVDGGMLVFFDIAEYKTWSNQK